MNSSSISKGKIMQQNVETVLKKASKEIQSKVEKYTQQLIRKTSQKVLQEYLEENLQSKNVVKKRKVKKMMGGFTKAENLIPFVTHCLNSYGPLTLSELKDKILDMKVLVAADYFVHSDGTYRFYKTLGRTKKIMLENQILVDTENGTWKLA